MRFLTIVAAFGCVLVTALAEAQTVQSINVVANHILYEPASGKIYASIPSSAGSNGNSIATIDPTTASIVRTVFIGSEPDPLAVSDDGQFLYVGLDGADAVRRYTIATHSAGLQFSLGSDPFFGPYHAGDIKVLPGEPHALAVSRNFVGTSPANNGVAIYDDGVQRTNVVTRQQAGLLDSLAFSASASVLYGQDMEDTAGTFTTLAVDSHGVTVSNAVNDLWGEFGGRIVFDATSGRVFDLNGLACDPQTTAIAGAFSQARQAYNYYGTPSGAISGIVPDTANGRVFFLIYDGFNQNSSVIVAAFDSNTFLPIGSLVLPNVIPAGASGGYAADLVPWGANGFAFRTNNGQIWLINGRSYPGLSRFHLGAAKVVGGATVTGTVTLSQPAPAGGATVNLSSSNYNMVTPPVSVTIAAGQTSAAFSVATSGGSQDVTLSATYGTQAITNSLQVIASASASVYPANVRVVHFTSNDLAFDTFTKLIYASVPSSVVGTGNNITAISPGAATIGASVFMGSEPYRLAISDDGQFLYAGLYGAAAIRRFDLQTQTADLEWSLGNSAYSGPYFPGQLVVLPGEPHSLAVSRFYPGFSPFFAGIPIYDDGVARPNVYTGFTGGECLVAGKTAGRLYGFDNETTAFEFDRFDVTSAGITLLDSTNNLFAGFGIEIAYAGGLIFAGSGAVINPEARTPVGTFSGLHGGALVLPSVADKTVYFLDSDYSGNTTLRLFDPRTFLEIVDFPLPGVLGYPSSLLRWKAGNVAFRTSAGQVFFVNATLPALAKLTIAPSKVIGGASATGTVQLSNVAPIGGIVVNIVSSSPGIVSVPSSVTVPTGVQKVSFVVQTSSVSTAIQVTLSASYKTLTKSATLTVNP